MTTYSEADECVVCRLFDRLHEQVFDALEVCVIKNFRESQVTDSLDESFRLHATKILVGARRPVTAATWPPESISPR